MISYRVSKTELRARMYALFRELQENGGEIIVTEGDKPVLRILPYEDKEPKEESTLSQVARHA